MGDVADYYRDQELDEQFRPKRTIDYKHWTCTDGDKIALKDMTKAHLENCINLINNKSDWRTEWLKPLQTELNNR